MTLMLVQEDTMRYWWVLLVIVIQACGIPLAEPTPQLDLLPSTTATPALPTTLPPPIASPATDPQWPVRGTLVELRVISVARDDQPVAEVFVVRCDPTQVRLRVGYDSTMPRSLRAWFAQERPVAMINGGFFNPQFEPTALLISDGVTFGNSYQGFGGMFAVTPDGNVSIRPLRDQPYQDVEVLSQAIQSFPMLVFPGGLAAAPDDNGQKARRSVVALDQQGRLLLIAAPASVFTLTELAQWLVNSDLGIDRALNLDGGSSTGLFVNDGSAQLALDSFGPLPGVLLIERR